MFSQVLTVEVGSIIPYYDKPTTHPSHNDSYLASAVACSTISASSKSSHTLSSPHPHSCAITDGSKSKTVANATLARNEMNAILSWSSEC